MPNRTPDLEVLCLREFRFEPPARRARNGGASAGHQCLAAAPAGRGGRGGGGGAGGARERENKRDAAMEARGDGGPRDGGLPPPHSAPLRCPPSHSPLSPCFLAPSPPLSPPLSPSSLTRIPLLPRPSSLTPGPCPPPPSALSPSYPTPVRTPGFPRSDRRIGKLRSGKSVIGPD